MNDLEARELLTFVYDCKKLIKDINNYQMTWLKRKHSEQSRVKYTDKFIWVIGNNYIAKFTRKLRN